MATKPPPKMITSWSFSRYSDYQQCPAKAKYKHVLRMKEPPNDAMARGTAIHTMAEDYIKGKLRSLPAELSRFKDEFKYLRGRFKKKLDSIVVEDTWAFKKDWSRTTFDDWVNCVVRIKLDCAYIVEEGGLTVMYIPDWKTGKFRPDKNADYIEQLELYALAALILYPHVDIARPQLKYIDEGVTYPPDDQPLIFKQEDKARLIKLWSKRTKAMLNDKSFAPRPNNLCRYCHFRASNGGPCKF